MERNTVEDPLHETVRSLEASRQMLRGVLLPPPGSAPGAFPRSQVMRLLFDGRSRRLVYGALTAAWMVLGKRFRRHLHH